jgi:hypothetical protein
LAYSHPHIVTCTGISTVGTVPNAVRIKLPADCVPGIIFAATNASYCVEVIPEEGEIFIVLVAVAEARETVIAEEFHEAEDNVTFDVDVFTYPASLLSEEISVGIVGIPDRSEYLPLAATADKEGVPLKSLYFPDMATTDKEEGLTGVYPNAVITLDFKSAIFRYGDKSISPVKES